MESRDRWFLRYKSACSTDSWLSFGGVFCPRGSSSMKACLRLGLETIKPVSLISALIPLETYDTTYLYPSIPFRTKQYPSYSWHHLMTLIPSRIIKWWDLCKISEKLNNCFNIFLTVGFLFVPLVFLVQNAKKLQLKFGNISWLGVGKNKYNVNRALKKGLLFQN